MAYAYIYEFNNTAIQLVSVHYALRHCHRFLTASWLSNSGPLFRLHCACDPLTLLLHLTLTVTPEAAGLPQCCFSALTWAPLLWCSSQLCSSRWWLSQWHWFCLRWEKHTCFYFFFFFCLAVIPLRPLKWMNQKRRNEPKYRVSRFLSSFQVHNMYRGGGGSMKRAQDEWSSGMWKSAPVREAGFNVVAQSAQGPSLPQYPAAVPNYPDNSHWWWPGVASRWRQITSQVCDAQECTSECLNLKPSHDKIHTHIIILFWMTEEEKSFRVFITDAPVSQTLGLGTLCSRPAIQFRLYFIQNTRKQDRFTAYFWIEICGGECAFFIFFCKYAIASWKKVNCF